MTHIIEECSVVETIYHCWPEDWIFGGADGKDPRADPRWHPTTYQYLNDRLEVIWVSQVPLCDDEALDYCTFVGKLGPGFNPVWVWAIRYNNVPQVLPWTYDKATDTLNPKE